MSIFITIRLLIFVIVLVVNMCLNLILRNHWVGTRICPLPGKMHEVPWSHLIFDDRYSDVVDIYEGDLCMHVGFSFGTE